MRFCPFCAQENADAASECAHCGRKLPQLASTPQTSGFPAVRPVTPPPRRLPRPVPRTRPVTPLPASEKVVPAPEAPRLVEAHGSARARSGTLLGIPAADTGATDMPTDENLRVAPEEMTAAEITAQSTRVDLPLVDADPPEPFGDLRARPEQPVAEFEASTDTEIHLPAPRHVPGPPPPVPPAAPALLPPPPMVTAPLRIDPDEVAPVAPSDSQPLTIDRRPTDALEPLPMPAHPGPGVLPAVKYLVPLAKAVWARHKAQGELRALLHDDQRRVDEALRDLGDAAWQMRPRLPELKGELDRADEDDGRRRGAEQELARLDMSVTAEKERFVTDAAARQVSIEKRETEVARLAEDLAERRRAQKTEEKLLRDIEARLRAAEKQVQQHEAAAYKAQQTPPEKGGGANAAANLREQAVLAQREVDGIKPDVEEHVARVRALDAPIAELEVAHTTERGQVTTEKAELEAARRAHADELARLEVARSTQIETREVSERAVRLRLVSTGTLLSLHRLDAKAHQPTFAPIYARLDELQGVAATRDARIGALEAERHGYDRQAVQRGLIALGGALGVLAILLVVLIVVIAHSH